MQKHPQSVTDAGPAGAFFLETLPRCLVLDRPEALGPLRDGLARALQAGGQPFEVLVGAPVTRYGPRVTILPREGRAMELARAFGFSAHPWGLPTWVGLRVGARGLRAKAYHRLASVAGRFVLPRGLPAGLVPVMGALDGASRELYLQLEAAMDWGAFVTACLAPLDLTKLATPAFAPQPRRHDGSFGLSLRWEGDRLAAVSLYADGRSLPTDAEIRREWAAGLDDGDRRAYDAALAAVRALGRAPAAGWHAMLVWTLDAASGWQRAAALRVPGHLVVPRAGA